MAGGDKDGQGKFLTGKVHLKLRDTYPGDRLLLHFRGTERTFFDSHEKHGYHGGPGGVGEHQGKKIIYEKTILLKLFEDRRTPSIYD